jgi:TAT (twin-arginine translocation) pathway signal sequence
MSIDRRELLKTGLAASAAVALPPAARADINFEPRSGAWRTFEIVTRMEVGKATAELRSCAMRNLARRCFMSNGRTVREAQSSK